MNGSDLGEMTTLRGKKNYQDLGRLIKFNGETGKNFMIFNFLSPNDFINSEILHRI